MIRLNRIFPTLAVWLLVVPLAQASRPNVLMILVDDLGRHDLSCLGSDYYETPHIDALAAKSLVFNVGYAASRVCSSSRASILTGQFTARHGITIWIGAKSGVDYRALGRHDRLLPAEYRQALPQDRVTLAEALGAAGYRTFYAGKWHLGGDGSDPEDHGFDESVGAYAAGSPRGGYFAPWRNPKLPSGPDGQNLTARLGAETSDYLARHSRLRSARPFFAVLSFYAVHSPLETTRERWAKYRDKAAQAGYPERGFALQWRLPQRTAQDNPVYAGLVESVDDAVGHVLRTLDETGLAGDTIVVFTSDHGGVCAGDASATTNAPLRGGKGQHYEGGLRVPAFLRAPGRTDFGKVTDAVTISTDWYPTLLDLCDVAMPADQPVDGTSLTPVLDGGALPERPLFWHYPHYGNQGGEPSSVIRRGRWKLIKYHGDDRLELYDVVNDPGEAQDVAGRFRNVADALADELAEFLASVDARFPTVDPEYDAVKARAYRRWIKTELLPRLELKRQQMLATDFDPGNRWWGSEAAHASD